LAVFAVGQTRAGKSGFIVWFHWLSSVA
jgi:hypothetical protein